MKYCLLIISTCVFVFSYSQSLDLESHHIVTGAYNPPGIYYSDLDLDGDQDIIVGVYSDNSVGWYENYGNRKFSPRKIITTASHYTTSVYAADIDNDGDPDILSSSRQDNKIAWYPNLRNGNFGAQIIISNQAIYTYSVHAADLDADGDIDVLSSSYNDDKIAWYPNLGNGTFGSPVTLSTSIDMATDVNTADMDNDGDPDIVASGVGSNSVVWFPNLGGGNFGPFQLLFSNSDSFNVCLTDLNMDGNKDIISTRNGGNQLRFHQNLGGGSFAPTTQIPGTMTSSVKGAVASDFDQDGDMDIIGGANVNTFLIENLGAMTFAPPVILAGVNSYELHSVDLDQDGLLDIIGSGGSSFQASIFFNEGNLTFQHKLLSGYVYRSTSLNTSDLDCDGDLDVLTTSRDDNKIGWHENLGNGRMTCQSIITELALMPSTIETFDIDNDGDKDIVYGSYNYDNICYMENLGNFQFGPIQVITTLTDGLIKISGGDINNDGWIDLISTSSGDDKAAYYLNLGGTGFGPQQLISTTINSPAGISVSDYDNDGHNDIAILGASGNFNFGWFKNLGNGTFSPIIYFQGSLNSGEDIFSEDIDEDGDLDIIAPATTSLITIYRNEGNGTFGPPQQLTGTGGYSGEMDMIDMNMDGYKDIVAFGGSGIKCLLFGANGTIIDQQQTPVIFDTPTCLITRDLDDDGDGDILISEFYNGINRWMENHTYESSSVVGRVFVDSNQNGVFDTGEKLVSGLLISASNSSSKTTTDELGHFAMNVNGFSGIHTLAPELNADWMITSDSLVYHIDLDSIIRNYTSLDFGIYPTGIHDSLDISFQSAPFSCGQNGASWIRIKNQGTSQLSASITLTLDANISIINAVPSPDSVINQTAYWNFTNLELFQDSVILLTTQTAAPNGTLLSSSVSASVNSMPLATSELKWIVNCNLNGSAKTANPPGAGTQGEISDSTHFIDYTVHFKNESLSIVNSLTIKDQLDTDLDWQSVQLTGSSIPFIMNVRESGKIHFVAENCNLVPSSTNDQMSTGYINFRVWLKDSLSQGTLLTNKAEINYDCRSVITNETIHHYYNCTDLSDSLPNPTEYCEGNPISFSLPGTLSLYDVEWQIENETPQTGLNFDWTADTSGQIPLNLTITNSACNLDSVYLLQVHPASPLTILPTITICQGDTTMIFGTPVHLPAVYTTTIQNMHGCDSIIEQELINYPITPVHVIDTVFICSGDTASIFGIPQTLPGIFYSTLQNMHGCDSIIGIQLNNYQPGFVNLDDFAQDTLCNYSPPVSLPNATPTGGTFSGIGVNGGLFSPSTAGLGVNFVYYSYLDNNGCNSVDSSSIFVDACLGTNDYINNDYGIQLFPNPFKEITQLLVPTEQTGAYDVSIYDNLGRKLIESTDQKTNEYFIHQSELGVGSFLVVVRQTNSKEIVFITKINTID